MVWYERCRINQLAGCCNEDSLKRVPAIAAFMICRQNNELERL